MAKEKKQTPRSMSKTPRKSKRKMSESSTGTKDNDNATPRAIVSPPRRVAPRISSPAASSLQRILVGGPLLGKKPQSISGGNKLVGWDTFEPIITAEISSESGKKPERYILLPHARHIAVLSYKTGIKVASLIPNASEQDEDVLIASVCLARYQRHPSETTIQDVLDRMDVDDDTAESPAVGTPQMLEEIVVMVGCHDGSIREFSLKDMADGSNESTENRPYQILGPTFHPRRVIKFEENNDPIMHLTIPYLSTLVREDGILAYVAMRIGIDSKSDRKKSSTVAVEVKRFLIPHFDGTTEVLLSNEEGNVTRISSIEKLTCKLVPSKQGSLQSTLPFRLLSATKPALTELSQQRQDIAVFVVLACMNRVSVYYEQLDSADTWEPVHLEMPVGNPLTTIDIALNKIDLTCGHYRGNIRVMNGALESVEKYHLALFKAKDLGRKPPHPQSQIISSRVHWHALPVSSLVYDSMSYAMDPLLYSGGDECVLVTWQIAQGKDRPVDVHPRLALGSIVHVASSDRCDNNAADGILVYCDDNTLQLLTSHNKSQVWKVQGLAGVADDESVTSSKGVSLEIDPRSAGSKESQIVITGLAQAPGYIHWFNPARERLNSSLEIAPFNRISRNEPEDSPLPSPTVTCHAFSKNGNDLITIDEHPTENVMVGYSEDTGKTDHGLVSTIRFWAFNNAYSAKAANAPYDQLASMTFPHGPKNRISAIAISNDGSTACSVSSSEKAFRLWHKISPKRPKAVQQASEKQAHTWICRCKVTVPSGFANFSTNEKGVAFSDDGSILAISFGHSITLWDADEARLLTSFTHNFGRSSIDKVSFVNPGLHKDLLLVQSKGGVSLRSPYGIFGNSESFDAWDYDVSGDKSFITSSELVYSHSCIAVAVYFPKKDKSRIIILGAEKGGVESFQLPKDIDGRIDALCSTGKREKRSNWSTDAAKNRISSLNLYALSSAGEMFQITESTTKQQLSFISGSDMTSASHFGPRLDMISPTGGHQKRQRTFTDTMGIAGPKKMALDVFGFGSSETGSTQPSTVELPSLSGNFVRSFVSRNLSRSA